MLRCCALLQSAGRLINHDVPVGALGLSRYIVSRPTSVAAAMHSEHRHARAHHFAAALVGSATAVAAIGADDLEAPLA